MHDAIYNTQGCFCIYFVMNMLPDRSDGDACTAYVTFKDAYSQETAVLLSVSTDGNFPLYSCLLETGAADSLLSVRNCIISFCNLIETI